MSGIKDARLERSARSDSWEIHWNERVGGRTVSRRLSTRTPMYAEAKAFLAGWIAEADRVETAVASPLVTDILDKYREHLEMNGKGETQFTCIAHLRRGFAGVRLCDLTITAQHRYRKARGVADATIRRELGALQAALGYARKHRIVPRAVIDDIDIELPRASQPRQTYLNRTEADQFLALADADSAGKPRLTRLTRFCYLALLSAARKEAIVGLTWDRVDWDAGTIDYREPGQQLTNKRRTLVPISKRLRPVLRRAYDERVSDYVLDSPASIRSSWETFIGRTPFAHITPHDLRRSFATLAVQAGVPVVDVAAILGDSVQIVMKHYAHHVPGSAQAAVDAV